MKNFQTLNKVLREQLSLESDFSNQEPYDFGRAMATVENSVVVVSDLSQNSCRIFCGRFGRYFGVENESVEPSIWEKGILARMSECDQDVKFLTELRFFHYLKKLPKKQRTTRYLATKLRMKSLGGELIDVLHRMYYRYGGDETSVRFAICVYGPLTFDFVGKSVVVDSLTGKTEVLSDKADKAILGRRETQIIALVDRGCTSAEIAELLSISKHTVSRHRQEILAKLQVKNSIEACRLAKALNII